MVPAGDLAVQVLAGIEGLGQLLGDGRAASLVGPVHQECLEKYTAQAFEVDARMLQEPCILRRDGRMDQMLGEVFIGNESPVFDMEGGQGLPILGDHLRGQLAVRVFQLLERGDLGKQPDDEQQKQHGGERHRHQDPEPLAYLFLRLFFHTFIVKMAEIQN